MMQSAFDGCPSDANIPGRLATQFARASWKLVLALPDEGKWLSWGHLFERSDRSTQSEPMFTRLQSKEVIRLH